MQFYSSILVLLLVGTCLVFPMGQETPFNRLDRDILIKIMACSKLEAQKNFHQTNKRLASIHQADLINQSPLIMSRKAHIYYLVQLTKVHSLEKNKKETIKNLLYNAHRCDHEDALDLLLILNPQLREPHIFPLTTTTALNAMTAGNRTELSKKATQLPNFTEIVQMHRAILLANVDNLFPQILALYRGDKALMDKFIYFIIGKEDPDEITINELNPLFAAAGNNNISLTELLLAQSHDLINEGDREGQTPLFITQSPEICKMLLSCKGIQPNKRPHKGRWCGITPFYKALLYEKDTLQNIFLNHPGFIINEEDENQSTPLHEAARRGQFGIFTYFFERTNGAVQSATKPLHVAASMDSFDIVNFILENDPTQINLRTSQGETPLLLASKHSNTPIVVLLLSKGALVDCANNEFKTPLWYAINNGHCEISTFLLDHGADINKGDIDGLRPIHMAASCNAVDVMELILKQTNVEINAQENNFCTALHIACSYGQDDMVHLLLKYGADIEATNNFGTTPLMVATAQGYPAIVQILLQNGADPLKQDTHGESAITIAKISEDDEMKACFIQLYRQTL